MRGYAILVGVILHLAVVHAASLVTAGAAAAQQGDAPQAARLRAGEHAGYSRIALDVPDLREWRVDRDGRRLTVTFPGRSLDFDTSQIFPGRRVSRVTAARVEGGEGETRLILSLACACDAEAYVFRSGMLVIDLRPEVAAPAVTAASPAAATQAASGQATETAEAPAASPTPIPSLSPTTNEAERVSLEQAQTRLLEQLARAADQGLIAFRSVEDAPPSPAAAESAPPPERSPDEGPEVVAAPAAVPATTPAQTAPAPAPALARSAPEAVPARSAPEAVPARSAPEAAGRTAASPRAATHPSGTSGVARNPETAAPSASAPAPILGPQLDARTVYDRIPKRTGAERANTCPDNAHLDVASWADAGDFAAQLAERRHALVAEFDRAAPVAAIALAQLYIGVGFGAEARQVLREFADGAPTAALLDDLAAIADDLAPDPNGRLAQAEACSGRIALWRIAAGFAPAPETVADSDWRRTVLEAFEALPTALRRRTGPPLLDRFVASGMLGEADAARQLLDRAPGDHGDAWRLASARLALAMGEGAAAERLLRAVVAGDGPEAPEGLLALADLVGARDGRLPEHLVEDLALAAFANQGSPLGQRLLVAEVLGRAGRDELGLALDTLVTQRAAGRASPRDLDAAMREILLTARADPVGHVAYAGAVMTHLGLMGVNAAWDPVRARVADELLATGLANVARAVLSPALGRGITEVRLAAARVETALGRPSGARALLLGLDGPDAAFARADALMAEGRHAEAFREVEAHLPAESEARAELAWRGGMWSEARGLPPPDPRRDLAEWMATHSAPPAEDAPATDTDLSLAAARAAVDAARDTRALIERALGDG